VGDPFPCTHLTCSPCIQLTVVLSPFYQLSLSFSYSDTYTCTHMHTHAHTHTLTQISLALHCLHGLVHFLLLSCVANWEWEDIIAPYGAAPTAFAYDENAVTVRVSPGSGVGALPQVAVGNGNTGVRVVNHASTGSVSSSNSLSVQYSAG
jgi:hypothetical protein